MMPVSQKARFNGGNTLLLGFAQHDPFCPFAPIPNINGLGIPSISLLHTTVQSTDPLYIQEWRRCRLRHGEKKYRREGHLLGHGANICYMAQSYCPKNWRKREAERESIRGSNSVPLENWAPTHSQGLLPSSKKRRGARKRS